MEGDKMTNMEAGIAALARSIGASTVAAILISACGGGGGDDGASVSAIKTLSNRADLVSGGDVLAEVVLPANADIGRLTVKLDGTDVTAQFARRSDGRVIGLVQGLKVGENTLVASIDGKHPVSLPIKNHPKGGPVFSGPQLNPWICMTDRSGNGLGPAQDEQCNAPTKVEYFYRSTNAANTKFLPYNPSSPPIDVATTTTDQGKKVPFIVRRERGTLNRYVYDIAVLADPAKPVSPFSPPPAWNKKLYYVFSGGSATQYIQGLAEPVGTSMAFEGQGGDVASVAAALSRGFATAASSGNVTGYNANTVVSAETMMMVKERVIKSLGEIRYTLSQGASGGSMQQHIIANAYPGLLDGIQPAASFPDIHTINRNVQDGSLLARYFDANPLLWRNVTQQNAVWENADVNRPGFCGGSNS